jgi:hypothetical protein
MSKAKYTDADFQKDLAELTNMINNYSTPAETEANMEGGKRKKRASKKGSKKGSKRGGNDPDNGANSGSNSSGQPTSHIGGAKHRKGGKRAHKKDVDGHLLRSFRIIEINNKDVSSHADWSSRFYHGKAKKNTPLQGAKNAYRWLRQHMGKSSKYTFKLMETTKGGDDYGKEFGPYVAKPEKLAKPIVFKLKNKRTGKKEEIVTEYIYNVHLSK